MKPKLIEFQSGDDICRAKLFVSNEPSSIIVIITAAIGQIQEQAPLQYAERLSKLGLNAVTFDHRYFGLSDGAPRQLEHPERKVEDIEALAKNLKQSPIIGDITYVVSLGICKGGAYSLQAASRCESIDAFIGVSGFYFDDVSLEAASGYKQERIDQGKLALDRYQKDGTIDYLPITSDTRKDAALPYAALHAWYAPWETYSRWQNRYAVMSDYYIYQLLSKPHAEALHKPALIIHANKSTNPGSAKQVFELIPHEQKRLCFYEDGVDFQTNFYEREALINRACGDTRDWLRELFQ
ncbi:MAG: alpha/beta hydrolase [Verrucomicrobiota bacterium]